MTDPDFRAQAERMIEEHRPEGMGGLDEIGFADLAANLGWDVENTVPLMAQQFGITEDGARELLLGARSELHGRELEDEA